MMLSRSAAVTVSNIVCVRRHVVDLVANSGAGFVEAVKGIKTRE
jgi:hypothetical protein